MYIGILKTNRSSGAAAASSLYRIAIQGQLSVLSEVQGYHTAYFQNPEYYNLTRVFKPKCPGSLSVSYDYNAEQPGVKGIILQNKEDSDNNIDLILI